MVNYTHPGVTINTHDVNTQTTVVNTADALHRPLIPSFAAKGPVGVPVYNDMSGHSKMFGTEMFSTSSDYAKTLPFEYINLIARSQRFYFLRLPDGSDTLGFAIFALAKTVTGATVYTKDIVNGVDYTSPSKDASGNTVTADQTQFTFVVYPISTNNPLTVAAVCAYYGVDPKDAATSLYLIMQVVGTSPGNFMTRNAISIDADAPTSEEGTLTSRLGAPLIRVYPRYCTDDSYSYLATEMTGSTYSFSAVENISGGSYVEFCPTMESVVDSSTSVDYGWEPILDSAYTSTSDGYLLDYNITVNVYGGTPMDQRSNPFSGVFAFNLRLYNELNLALGNITDAVTVANMTASEYQAINKINPFTGKDLGGCNYLSQPLGAVAPDNSVNGVARFGKYSNIFNYDSSAIALAKPITDYNIDLAVRTFFDINLGNLETISDPFAVTYNQLYDPGYSFETKRSIANILDIRDDVKVDWTSETFMGVQAPNADTLPKWLKRATPVRTPNDFATSLSAILTLSSIITNHGIDDKYGTQNYRGEIYCQTEEITSYGNRKVVIPVNYERLKQRLAYYSGPTVTGSPKGRPGNVLSSANSLSWVPLNEEQKQMIWSRGANYACYADVNTLFFPDIRTPVSDENSILSSGTYTDHIDQFKHIIRDVWTYYTGLEIPVSRLITDIENAIDTQAHLAFGDYLTTKTTVQMQDSNSENAYTARVSSVVIGNMSDRIWDVVLTTIKSSDVTTTTTTN